MYREPIAICQIRHSRVGGNPVKAINYNFIFFDTFQFEKASYWACYERILGLFELDPRLRGDDRCSVYYMYDELQRPHVIL